MCALLLGPLLSCAASDERTTLAVQALSALRRGEVAALEALPVDAAPDPPDLPDPAEPGLRRRWSLALPALVAGLDPAARERALAVLDRRARTGLALGGAATALDALPAPLALAALGRAADRAFDHGRMTEALLLWRLAGINAGPRRTLAERLAGRCAPAEPPLPEPGVLVPAAPPPMADPGADGARGEGPWLVRRDPWERLLWRRPLDAETTVEAGGGWTLVQGRTGLAAVDPDGRARALRPPPPRTRVRAVAAGSAWFVRTPAAWARGRAGGDAVDAWRHALADGRVEELALPEEPLGAPLVRGERSLWLGRLRLWLVVEGRLTASALHGRQLSPEARLRWWRDQAWVVDGTAAWTLENRPGADDDGLLRAGQPGPADAVQARREDGWLVVEARRGDRLCWTRRWAALPLDQAPSQLALLDGGRVTVVEGWHHLTTLSAADGALVGWGCLFGAEIDPARAVAWAPRCAAALAGERLLVTVEGREQAESLPAPGHALTVEDGALTATLADGRREVRQLRR